MREQGADIAFSCERGVCLTCILQLISGDPGQASVGRLPGNYRDLGLFLPCCAMDVHEVKATAPDLTRITHDAMVAEKQTMPDNLLILRLELVLDIDWQPGQTIELLNAEGTGRSYSITSRKEEDYFLELHLRVHPRGAVSAWARERLRVGDMVQFRAPSGDFVYREDFRNFPLVMIGTGTGGGALLGIAREALARGHAGPIYLYHGARTHTALYLRSEMEALAARDQRLAVAFRTSRDESAGQPSGRISDLALSTHPNLDDSVVYLCGNPGMVTSVRDAALLRGVDPTRIVCDLFEPHGHVTHLRWS